MSNTSSLIIDAALAAGFGFQHSVLATIRVKHAARALTRIDALAWRSVESLVNILYIFVAALLWQPVDLVLWNFPSWGYYVASAILIASWLWYWQLHLFEYDCGLAFGSTSLVSALAGRSGLKNPLWRVGTRRWIRFPVHTAFFPMFFAFPTMRADVFVLAVVINAYNMLGTVLYDRRLIRLAGEQYQAYRAVTGLILPNFRRLEGAAGIPMAEPRQWKSPRIHARGALMGGVLGIFYWFAVGVPTQSAASLAIAAAAGLAGSAIVGLVQGAGPLPGGQASWQEMQINLSASVALASALGIVVWALLIILHTRDLPYAAPFLPMWFTVQYLGHVVAYLAGHKRWFGDEAAVYAGERPNA
jgi:methanethiol S-methyltransferase